MCVHVYVYVIFPGEGKTIGPTVNEKVKKARRKKKILSLMFQIVSQDGFPMPLKQSFGSLATEVLV